MNGYKVLADSYRKAAEQGKVEKAQAEKHARVLDFLGTCDDEDINALFDSSAFNEISKSYMRRAVKELIEEKVIDEEQGQAVKNRFSLLFSEMTAKDVLAV